MLYLYNEAFQCLAYLCKIEYVLDLVSGRWDMLKKISIKSIVSEQERLH